MNRKTTKSSKLIVSKNIKSLNTVIVTILTLAVPIPDKKKKLS